MQFQKKHNPYGTQVSKTNQHSNTCTQLEDMRVISRGRAFELVCDKIEFYKGEYKVIKLAEYTGPSSKGEACKQNPISNCH